MQSIQCITRYTSIVPFPRSKDGREERFGLPLSGLEFDTHVDLFFYFSISTNKSYRIGCVTQQ